jgi:hypothetical protein
MTNSGVGLAGSARRVRVVVAVCVAFAALASAQTAVAVPNAPGAPYVGFNDASALETRPQAQRYALSIEAVTAYLRQAGSNTIRYPVLWNIVQPGRTSWNWARYDRLYSQLTAKGIRPILLVSGSPIWSRPTRGDDAHLPHAPAYDAHWVYFLYELARRYPKAAAIELWNEPNLAAFFKPAPDPARYTKMLCLGWFGAKSAVPSMPVIVGGLSGVKTTGGGNIAMTEYLTKIYANGGGPCADGVGYHAHTHNDNRGNEEVAWKARYDQVRGVMDANGQGAKHVWMTEAGYTTAGGQGDTRTEAEQAALLPRMIRWHGSQPKIDSVIVHSLMPFGDSGSEGQGYAVMYKGWWQQLTFKPAFCAIAILRRATCGSVLATALGLADPPTCGNGRDDDGDGRVDAPDDTGCASRLDADER